MSTASPAVRHTTTAAVAAVGLIAAIVSYAHMQQLGEHHGEAWRSWLVPISIDGLMAAASMVLLTRRRSGLPSSPLAWLALILGGITSLAANMADAQPNATAILYAGWAPLGFLLAFELLLQQRRAEGLVAEPVAVIDGLRAGLAQARCDLATALARQADAHQISPARQAESHQPIHQVSGASSIPGEQEKPTDTAGLVVPPQPARPVAPKASRQLTTPGGYQPGGTGEAGSPAAGERVPRTPGAGAKAGCTSHQARQVLDHLKTSTKRNLHAVATGCR